MMRKLHRHLSRTDRLKFESLLSKGISISKISLLLDVHRSTLYREKKRGSYMHRNSDWTEEIRYSADIGQQIRDEGNAVRGTGLKIGNNLALANYIEDRIVNEKLSPEALCADMKQEGIFDLFGVTLCPKTIRNYIEKRVFRNLCMDDLPYVKKKRRTRKIVRLQKRANAGESIEQRPKKIEKREEFGHWEMDTVVSCKEGKKRLLVLTERKTRYEIVILLKDGRSSSVVKAIDHLEKKYREKFPLLFKSITVDNGVEFSDAKRIERSKLNPGTKRTKLYYCHAYSSWERGSNEKNNQMIRRHFPKGTNFDHVTKRQVVQMTEWLNNYRRGILNWRSSADLFHEEYRLLSG